MRSGNYLIIASSRKALDKYINPCDQEKTPRVLDICELGRNPHEQHVNIVRADCLQSINCARCGEPMCPGCNKQFVIDIDQDSAVCNKCRGTTIWDELLGLDATGVHLMVSSEIMNLIRFTETYGEQRKTETCGLRVTPGKKHLVIARNPHLESPCNQCGTKAATDPGGFTLDIDEMVLTCANCRRETIWEYLINLYRDEE